MRVPVHNSLGDLCDRRCDRHNLSRVFLFLFDAVLIHQVRILCLTFAHRISRCDDLILLDIDHGIHLDKARIILQRDKIRRFTRNVQKKGKRRGIVQILHLSLGGCHRRRLRRAFHLIEPGLHRALIHEHESYIGLIPAD